MSDVNKQYEIADLRLKLKEVMHHIAFHDLEIERAILENNPLEVERAKISKRCMERYYQHTKDKLDSIIS